MAKSFEVLKEELQALKNKIQDNIPPKGADEMKRRELAKVRNIAMSEMIMVIDNMSLLIPGQIEEAKKEGGVIIYNAMKESRKIIADGYEAVALKAESLKPMHHADSQARFNIKACNEVVKMALKEFQAIQARKPAKLKAMAAAELISDCIAKLESMLMPVPEESHVATLEAQEPAEENCGCIGCDHTQPCHSHEDVVALANE